MIPARGKEAFLDEVASVRRDPPNDGDQPDEGDGPVKIDLD